MPLGSNGVRLRYLALNKRSDLPYLLPSLLPPLSISLSPFPSLPISLRELLASESEVNVIALG